MESIFSASLNLERVLTLSQTSPVFLRVCSNIILKTLREKEKLLVTSNFSFSRSVFHPFRELSAIFHRIQSCRLQTLSVWKILKFVVLERIKVIMSIDLALVPYIQNLLYNCNVYYSYCIS